MERARNRQAKIPTLRHEESSSSKPQHPRLAVSRSLHLFQYSCSSQILWKNLQTKVEYLGAHGRDSVGFRSFHLEDRMAKHIFVTGGVVSSLGKGLTSASIGLLLERRGL